MSDWVPQEKKYPHFDADLGSAKLDALVKDPARVAANGFYPFMRYSQEWQPFRSRPGGKPDRKSRPIRFASRRDAAIFSYYRHVLSELYEREVLATGIGSSVIAYRKIPAASGGGKSNIEFARDAFLRVRQLGRCGVVTLDIKSFFETLDHKHLEGQWLRLLGMKVLPPDHRAVFRAVTSYAVVDRDRVYERLGHLRLDRVRGRDRYVAITPFEQMPRKICSNADFQEKICGKGGRFDSLIEKNKDAFGIPQGSPISDLLANIYMLDFDVAMSAAASAVGGTYYRYSDDVMLIVPGGEGEARAILATAVATLGAHAPRLEFKASKTSVHVFEPDSQNQTFRRVEGRIGRNGLEYLGFRYDGRRVRIRDATMSGLYRKVTGLIHVECHALAARYPGKDTAFLFNKFDFAAFFQRHGRVKDFDPHSAYKHWTFWTYAKRALKTFGPLGAPIARQVNGYKPLVRSRVAKIIAEL